MSLSHLYIHTEHTAPNAQSNITFYHSHNVSSLW